MGSSYTSAPWQAVAINIPAIIVFYLSGHTPFCCGRQFRSRHSKAMCYDLLRHGNQDPFWWGPQPYEVESTDHPMWLAGTWPCPFWCLYSKRRSSGTTSGPWVPGCNQQVLVNLPLWSAHTSLKLLLVVFGMLPTMFIFQVRMVYSTSLHPHWRQ